MRYISTRYDPSSSSPSSRRYSFREAVLAGWAPDGGMFLPERIPHVSLALLESWRGLTYPELVTKLLALFMDDGDAEDATQNAEVDKVPLRKIVHASFASFAVPEVVRWKALPWPYLSSSSTTASSSASPPLSRHPLPSFLEKQEPPSLYIAELFHGPSLAFKDLGMQVLTNLLEHYLLQEGRRMTFLVGTSGDTGPSAAAAVQGKVAMRLVVLYPLGRVSTFQEAQMLAAHDGVGGSGEKASGVAAEAKAGTLGTPNVRVVAVEGSSDDLDVPIASLFGDPAYRCDLFRDPPSHDCQPAG